MDFPQCRCWSAKLANKLQQHGVSLQFTKTDQVLAQVAMKKWELNWLALRLEEACGDPEGIVTVARYSQWFRAFSLGEQARLHPYLRSGFQIPKGHIHSVTTTCLPRVETKLRALGRG
jgi:hypothetical protein